MTTPITRAAPSSPAFARIPLPMALIMKDDKDDELAYRLHAPAYAQEIDAIDAEGKTLLMQLIIARAYKCAVVLVRDFECRNVHQADAYGFTALHYTCAPGNAEKAQENEMILCKLITMLLGKGASMLAKDNKGWTPLHFAAYQESVLLIKQYYMHALELGEANLGDCVFTQGTVTPIHIVAASPSQSLDLLLQIYDNVDLQDPQQNSPLHIAVMAQDPATALKNSWLCLTKSKSPNLLDANGETALSLACLANREEVALQLVRFTGTSSSTVDLNLGTTPPLVGAYLNGNMKLFSELLQRGANPNAKWGNDYLLDIVSAKNDQATVRLLQEKNVKLTAAQEAMTKHRNPRSSKLFSMIGSSSIGKYSKKDLEKGEHLRKDDPEGNTGLHQIVLLPTFDIELLLKYTSDECWNKAVNKLGEPPFLYCCRVGTIEQVIRLLQMSVNPFAIDGEGNNALHKALLSSSPLVFYFLATTFKPLIDQPNAKGETPLYWATRLGLRQAVDILLDLQAKPDTCDKVKNTLLHALCEAPKTKDAQVRPILDRLSVKKPNLNAENTLKKPPLVVAWEHQSIVFKRLLELGAKADVELKDGYTLLMKVCAVGDFVSAQQLVLAGSDRNSKGATTPLIAACQACSLPTVELLLDKRLGCASGKKKLAHPDRGLSNEIPLTAIIREIFRRTTIKPKTDKDRLRLDAGLEDAYKILKTLIKAGAKLHKSITLSSKVDTNPLTLAIQNGLVRVVQELMDGNVDVERKASGNRSPFVVACKSNNVQIAKMLHAKIGKISTSLVSELEKDKKLSIEMRTFIHTINPNALKKAPPSQALESTEKNDPVAPTLVEAVDYLEPNDEDISPEHSETSTREPSQAPSAYSSQTVTPRGSPSGKGVVTAQELALRLGQLALEPSKSNHVMHFSL